MYDHVRHLVANGYRAFVVHQNLGFRPGWFHDELPVLYCDHQFSLEQDDIIIIPEDHAGYLELFRSAPVRKILFCQNHFYIYEGLRSHASWRDLGITGVMACSDSVAEFIRSNLDWQCVQTVHCALHPAFTPALQKEFQLAYMPRKRPLEAKFIRNLCTQLLEPEITIKWIEIDGMTQEDAAKVLGESALFLSLSRLEGFGLPPLEAMASGCLVAGFTGFGGREYARPDNGLWCDEDDLIGCARILADAVRMLKIEAPAVSAFIKNSRQTAACYTYQRQEQELMRALNFFLH